LHTISNEKKGNLPQIQGKENPSNTGGRRGGRKHSLSAFWDLEKGKKEFGGAGIQKVQRQSNRPCYKKRVGKKGRAHQLSSSPEKTKVFNCKKKKRRAVRP